MGWTLDELHGLDQEYDEALRSVAPQWLGIKAEPTAGESAEEWTRILSEGDGDHR